MGGFRVLRDNEYMKEESLSDKISPSGSFLTVKSVKEFIRRLKEENNNKYTDKLINKLAGEKLT